MSYSKHQNEYNKEYVKECQKQIMIKYRRDDYDNRIRPAIAKSGMPTATFIKQAIQEKIERDGLLEKKSDDGQATDEE